jgi:hypothetical protein
VVEALDLERLRAVLSRRGLAFEPAGSGLLVQAEPAVVGQLLVEERIVPTALVPSQRSTIEDVFLELTSQVTESTEEVFA